MENNVIKFQYYGKSDFSNDVSYAKENILLLNKAFIDRGYDSLEVILNSKSLNCHCSHENSRLNFIWSDNGSRNWLLEIKNDSLFINNVDYLSEDPDPDDSIIVRRFKAYKW